MKRTIYFTNSGNRLTADVMTTILQAYRQELVCFCNDHNLEQPELVAAMDASTVPPGSEVIDFADQPPSDQDGVLGEHFEILGKARGLVFAGYELDNGGTLLANAPDGATTVAAIGYHELTEQLRNPTANVWWDGPISVGGMTYASVVGEVADPVEGDYVIQNVSGVEVWLSNTILPAWWDPEATTGPFDTASKLSAPFTKSPGGYVVVRNAPGGEQPIFGEAMPAHRRRLKQLLWTMRFRRRAAPTQAPTGPTAPTLSPPPTKT